jgi:predicted negative regulator of RcsB-dependent stress response
MPILENIKENISLVITVVLFCSTAIGWGIWAYDRSQDSKQQYANLQVINITEAINELKDDTKEIKDNVVKIKTDVAVIKSKQGYESDRISRLEKELIQLYVKVGE